jgi:uncharacterized repeat protein (TIGR03803 family)
MIMNSARHRGWLSRARLQEASAVVVFAVAFAVVAIQSARAQTFSVLYSFTGNGGTGKSLRGGLVRDAAGNLYGTTYQGGGFYSGTVFKVDAAGKLTVLHNFAGGTKDGANPLAGLIRDAAGSLYGTTYGGGTYNLGAVFKVDTSGKESVLYSFAGSPDGAHPAAGLVQDAAGNFYGTTENGGYLGTGTIYKLDKNGTETVLYSFAAGADGAYPEAGLVLDGAGNLYGTTAEGGGPRCYDSLGCGTVFKLDTAGKETVLYSFGGSPDGEYPVAGLLRDNAGNLYGTTSSGGASSFGTVFKLDTTGKETVLYSFAGSPDGEHPYAGLVQDAAGDLYGTTSSGGASSLGTVFKLDTTGKESILYSFAQLPDGEYPYVGLVHDTAGNLYGATDEGGLSGLGTVFKLDTTGKETVLYSFVAGSGGAGPYASLVRDAAGNFYGTTYWGGTSGLGTAFKLTKRGKETVLHSFTGSPDGAYPSAGLAFDAAGNLYGTTVQGGNSVCGESGCGTAFKIDTSGKETVLYTFCSVYGCTDGARPYAGFIRDAAGNLYGTTSGGGAYGDGTVLKLGTSGAETVLYSFTGGTWDGAVPYAGLVRDNAGNLYGTTYENGASGNGAVFKVNAAGKETVLYNFINSEGFPYAGLLRDKDGNLYGTAAEGAVFKLDTSGKETVLHYFRGADGAKPYAGLVQDTAGNLYGTTYQGGDSGLGVVFKLDTTGTLTVLHYFAGGAKDGAYPMAGLIRDAAGNFYGTTYGGGTYNLGTVFKLTLPSSCRLDAQCVIQSAAAERAEK